MPIVRDHKKDLRLSLPLTLTSPWNSVLNTNQPNRQLLTMDSACDVTLNDNEARAITGDSSDCIDDLVSECSTPCSTLYTPGKYLQLCGDLDLSDSVSDTCNDATLFSLPPQSSAVSDEDLSVSWNNLQRYRYSSLDSTSSFRQVIQKSTRSQLFPVILNKTLLIVALCMMVAFTALGCLAPLI